MTLGLLGCGGSNSKNNTQGENRGTTNSEKPQLNISILLDLSDRIDPITSPEVPEHYERDIANIKHITALFVKDMASRGTFMSKGKLKVIFSPRPQDANVNIFAENLNVDLSKMQNKQKKEVYDNLTTIFPDNLLKIYESTISAKRWIGSDIWRFFKNDVKDYCVSDQSNYRNILIIFTDGYIYHADSKDKSKNRYSYILPSNINQFRNNPNWESDIKKNDFGLIAKRSDLENLEVLVLEVSPSPTNKNDEDIIKTILSKWFDEMKVKRYAIFNSDLPEYTKQRIEDFIK
jgi:hypothetical protein